MTGPRADDSPASTARHARLAEAILTEIADGLHPVGGRFPSEEELQARFGVGRHTIREALKVLAEQGVLGRRRKTGTVVLARQPIAPYVHSLRDVRGLLDFAATTRLDIAHEGFVSTLRGEAEADGPAGDGRWLRLAGVRYRRSDNEALCWSEILVPQRFAPDREQARAGGRAIYDLVLERHGLKLDYVEQEVSAGMLSKGLIAALRAESQGAGLLVKRRYVASSGATFEISHNIYPANRYSMRSVIRQRA
jgi:DNA-binding GntR family transcriptional regulator